MARRAASLVFAALLGCCAAARGADWIYTVQPGDNPWNLTERYLDGLRYWPLLQRLNRITQPRTIPPGTRLRVPVEWLRPEPQAVRVTGLVGSAELIRDGGAVTLAPGMTFTGEARVRTAAASNVELAFADGARVLLLADSEMRVERHVRFANTDMVDTRLQLLRGRSESLANAIRGIGGRFEIRTPAAITSVRGTHLRVATRAGEARTEVLAGRVGVENPLAAVQLGAGQGTIAVVGAPPRAPVALLPAPDLAGIDAVLDRRPLDLRVAPLPGAIGYRLQIADHPEFKTLTFDGAFETPNLAVPDLADGDYALRVRGIDADRLEGADAASRVRINLRPEPPILREPVPGAQIVATRPVFRWAQVPGALRYRFELAPGSDLTGALIDRTDLLAVEFTPDQDLSSGPYAWRVTAIDGDGPGPTGDIVALRLAPAAPAAAPPGIEADRLTLRWRAGRPGQRYRYQVARERDFLELLAEDTTAQPQAVLPRPPPGSYFVRIATIDVDGFVGRFGDPQHIELPEPPTPWWPLVIPLLFLLLV